MSRFELGEEVDFVLLGNYFYRGIIVGRKTTHCKGMWEESYDIDTRGGITFTDIPKGNIIKPEKKEIETNKILFVMEKALNDMRCNIRVNHKKENEMIPTYIGYKNRTVTLVWSDGSKTQAIAKENEEVYFLYGFLIAYYKKVNEQLSSKEIQHRLENIVYLREKEFQYGYLTSVFRENCGLSIRKQDQFIAKYIYSIAPFEIEQENFAKTYKIDDRFRT